jgi:hypothetical protein
MFKLLPSQSTSILRTEGIFMLGFGIWRHEEISKAVFSFKEDKLYVELQSFQVENGQFSHRRKSNQ